MCSTHTVPLQCTLSKQNVGVGFVNSSWSIYFELCDYKENAHTHTHFDKHLKLHWIIWLELKKSVYITFFLLFLIHLVYCPIRQVHRKYLTHTVMMYPWLLHICRVHIMCTLWIPVVYYLYILPVVHTTFTYYLLYILPMHTTCTYYLYM